MFMDILRIFIKFATSSDSFCSFGKMSMMVFEVRWRMITAMWQNVIVTCFDADTMFFFFILMECSGVRNSPILRVPVVAFMEMDVKEALHCLYTWSSDYLPGSVLLSLWKHLYNAYMGISEAWKKTLNCDILACAASILTILLFYSPSYESPNYCDTKTPWCLFNNKQAAIGNVEKAKNELHQVSQTSNISVCQFIANSMISPRLSDHPVGQKYSMWLPLNFATWAVRCALAKTQNRRSTSRPLFIQSFLSECWLTFLPVLLASCLE